MTPPSSRSLRDPDVVCDRVPGLADSMIERPGDLRWDVLNERAPARHVEDLNPLSFSQIARLLIDGSRGYGLQ